MPRKVEFANCFSAKSYQRNSQQPEQQQQQKKFCHSVCGREKFLILTISCSTFAGSIDGCQQNHFDFFNRLLQRLLFEADQWSNFYYEFKISTTPLNTYVQKNNTAIESVLSYRWKTET